MFTVIIPLYNKEQTIKNTLESVLNQSLQDFEIVVMDDGSTDKSVNIVKSINDSRIKLIRQTNQGVSAARNNGIKEAQYNWLAFLDGDDEWESDYLENISQAVKKDPECIAYCTNFSRVDFNGRSTKITWKYTPEVEGRISNYYKACFFSFPIITSSSVCLNRRKLVLDSVFPIGVKNGEDLDTWVRLLPYENLYVINKKLVKIQVVRGGNTHLKERKNGEFDYKKWFVYQCDSNAKVFWLRLYAIKKLYEKFKEVLVLHAPWLYEFYIYLKRRQS